MLKQASVIVLLSCIIGCATISRLPAPPMNSSSVLPSGFEAKVRINSNDLNASSIMSAWIAKAVSASDGSVDIIAFSGGGAAGAFGAGVLVGMQQSGARPKFEIVTGVSTGSLLAPFAFLGPDWDDELTAIYNGAEISTLVVSRGLGAPFYSTLYRTSRFNLFVQGQITPRFMEAIALESRRGRLLLASTTNVDTGVSTIWNLGLIAESGGPQARRLFIDVLIASSSIPAVFPPKLIDVITGGSRYQEMHVDGSVAVPFFVLPEAMALWNDPNELLKGANLYVVLNGQLETGAANRQLKTTSLVVRSFEIDQVFRARQNIALTIDFAKRNEVNFRFTRLPPSFPYQGSLKMDQQSMKSLFDEGLGLATTGRAWLNSNDLISEMGRQEALTRPAPETARAN
jgi:Patatin-like phospholipase